MHWNRQTAPRQPIYLQIVRQVTRERNPLADVVVEPLVGPTALSIGFGVLIIGGVAGGWWVSMHPELLERLRPGATWLMAGLVLTKLVIAISVLRANRRRRLVTSQSAALIVGAWCLAVAGLSAAVWWWLAPGAVSLTAAAGGFVLFVPFSRLSVAPLALYWNRHR